jgi:hypothetical protein
MEQSKLFQKTLPESYREVYHLDARKPKVGVIMNLIALGVLGIVMAIAYIPVARGGLSLKADIPTSLITYLAFLASMVLYTVLHELVHGVFYKYFTGEKLTFGMSWSCAFCGVPHIFTYRKTALIAVVAPFAVFTLLFIPILILLYFVSPLYYLVMAVVFGLHLGGCSGDLYVLYLLTAKFKDKKTLMRDTGPEQYFYVYEGT